jgi:hypothetical protein
MWGKYAATPAQLVQVLQAVEAQVAVAAVEVQTWTVANPTQYMVELSRSTAAA